MPKIKVMKNKETLSFKISSGLKNIIGKDLVGNKYVAIFELVKNSYDANAEHVTISYLRDENNKPSLIISDDGIGMNYNDLINKWLFVAYSEKNKRNRPANYIKNIERTFTGAKGIGRFSCDRLGENLTVYTKKKNENIAHCLEINWSSFDENDQNQFINIPVDYSTEEYLPNNAEKGTILKISNLREEWSRNDFIALRHSLEKLVSPDLDKNIKPFCIKLNVPEFTEQDSYEKEIGNLQNVINGIIENKLIEQLKLKTIDIEVNISEDGREISTSLYDRNVFILKIIEHNSQFALLKNIKCHLVYLNRAAKLTFTYKMGFPCKDYGSIFIYKNGFRINPYGEPGQDFFGIDSRKAQGYNRYLGTREIMGRIQILGDNDDFTETSSRDQGFIRTLAVDSLETFFYKKVLMVLEKYVVNLISWGEPLRNDGHIITPEEISDQIISQFINITIPENIKKIEYNKEVFLKNNTINSLGITSDLSKLAQLAAESENTSFQELAKSVIKNTENIQNRNIELEKENQEKTEELASITSENEARKKQIFFLEKNSNHDVNTLINEFHIIYTLADGNLARLNLCLKKLQDTQIDKTIQNKIYDIYRVTNKIRKICDLVFMGNANTKKTIKGDVCEFISEYIDSTPHSNLEIFINATDSKCICSFQPASIGIIIDNVISNSEKNAATNLMIDVVDDNDYISISFSDNGVGLSPNISADSIFERGFSSNQSKHGFGIGLATIKDLVMEMNGSVKYIEDYKKGFKIEVKIKK